MTLSATTHKQKRAPSGYSIVKESRAVFDFLSTPVGLLSSKFSRKQLDGTLPIMFFPGFGSDEKYLKPFELYLRNLGYDTEDWGLGINLAGMNLPHTLEDLQDNWDFDYPDDYTPENYKGEGGVPYLCDKAIERVRARSQELGTPFVLIGWSLGGVVARECARELPKEVAQVVTFGTPVIGGPKYSRAAKLFKAKGYDLDWIETSIEKRNQNLIQQPITCIYSRSDEIVADFAAIDTISPNAENIHVNTAHLGMGFNQKIWRITAKALKKQAAIRAAH